jgi:hypothetical protein
VYKKSPFKLKKNIPPPHNFSSESQNDHQTATTAEDKYIVDSIKSRPHQEWLIPAQAWSVRVAFVRAGVYNEAVKTCRRTDNMRQILWATRVSLPQQSNRSRLALTCELAKALRQHGAASLVDPQTSRKLIRWRVCCMANARSDNCCSSCWSFVSAKLAAAALRNYSVWRAIDAALQLFHQPSLSSSRPSIEKCTARGGQTDVRQKEHHFHRIDFYGCLQRSPYLLMRACAGACYCFLPSWVICTFLFIHHTQGA